ncbi:uncharacterized protein APUU_41491A [Aspergillus puulaauensis]|uniref:Aminoglycoside phosphotransferase domain-containing protein n=1 Tax=Aspergillus puulaauensis TaxID=1220207 RepID=A0A7R8ANM4_9EURO|nr:uncharacterized protein APUU_41491A [Aspergillus puulaauensis]BCS25047.1 hypothetical protein APUU_41491A [Aspergillus puulaauensis]
MIVTDKEILNPSVPDLPSKDQVVELCRQKGLGYNHLTYTTVNGKIFFIKYNNIKMAEAHAQLFFSTCINANSQSSIRIPELYLAWLPDHSSSAYLVMEYIDIHHFASDEERAKALSELIAVKPPPGVFGNFGPPGGYIRHMFFKDRVAAKIYSSVQELQDSINHLLQNLSSGNGQDYGTVDFSNEPLLYYYSDIYRENFPVDQSGNLWVIDFDTTGVLPASFASWPLDTKYKHPLPIPIRRTIPLGTSKNLKPMFRAYRFNQISIG